MMRPEKRLQLTVALLTHHHPVHRRRSQTQFQYTSAADGWAGQAAGQNKIGL